MEQLKSISAITHKQENVKSIEWGTEIYKIPKRTQKVKCLRKS